MEPHTRPDGSTQLRFYSPCGTLVSRVREEFDDPNSGLCFAKAAAGFSQGNISLDQYLDAVLLHLKSEANGGARHLHGTVGLSESPELDLAPYQLVDIFAGSVRALVRSDDFQPMSLSGRSPARGIVFVRPSYLTRLRMEYPSWLCRPSMVHR